MRHISVAGVPAATPSHQVARCLAGRRPNASPPAKEAGIRSWLRTTMRQPDARVDELIAGWATEADARGLSRRDGAFWSQARPWLEERSN